jgi:putative PIN family toxin of toxin-antitoxin system
LFTEYYEVLHRKKFSKYTDFVNSAEQVLAYIEQIAVKYTSTKTLDIISDEADNRLLELADASNADYLVTGNTNDFIMSVFNNTKIISAKDFWLIIAG